MSETKEVSIEQAEYEILQSLLDTADLSIKETSASTQEMDTLQRVLRTLKEEVDKKRPYLPTDEQAEYEILQSLLDTADLSIKETSASTQEMYALQRVLRALKEEVDKKRPYLPTDHPHYKPRELTMYEKKYEHTLSGDTIHELIDKFNHQRGIRVPSNNRWGYLREIDRAIMSSGFDCTAVEGPEKRLDRSHRIKLEGQCIVQIIED